MAEIQSALSAKIMQVAGAHKTGHKDLSAASAQPPSFFGVLKTQLAKLDVAELELTPESPDTRFDLPNVPPASADAHFALAGIKLSGERPESPSEKPESPSAQPEPPSGLLAAAWKQDSESFSRSKVDGATAAATTAATAASEVSAPAPLANDAALQAVAAATVASLNLPVRKPNESLSPTAESDVALTQPIQETGARLFTAVEKPVVSEKPDAVLKAGATAAFADARQSLPPDRPAKQADSSPAVITTTVDATLETRVSPALSALSAPRVDAGVGAVTTNAAPVIQAQPFDQVLRQAESRINVAIEAPVRSAAFAAELTDKIVWLAGRQGQFAELSLNPPQMGALEVRLTLSGGDASAQFFSPNPVVREALDSAMPRLRELMAQAGITLGEADVREHAFNSRDQSEMRGQIPARDGEISAHTLALAGIGEVRSGGLGLVDLYI